MVSFSLYSTMPSRVDDSVWGVAEDYPGYLMRLHRGNNPPESCKTQIFEVPGPAGYDPRRIDMDGKGVVWTGLAATSHPWTARGRSTAAKEGCTLDQAQSPRLKGTDVPIRPTTFSRLLR
jgi:hypothetical protein